MPECVTDSLLLINTGILVEFPVVAGAELPLDPDLFRAVISRGRLFTERGTEIYFYHGNALHYYDNWDIMNCESSILLKTDEYEADSLHDLGKLSVRTHPAIINHMKVKYGLVVEFEEESGMTDGWGGV